MTTKHRFLKLFLIIAILAMLFSNIQPPTVRAQSGDGLKRLVNAQSGKVSFIGPEDGHLLSAPQALGTFVRPQDPAMALAKRFAPEFGLQNPERDLSEMKSNRKEDGRLIVRYQQNYEGIPVMGGELIVNTNDRGDLYSMNGEVSSDLSLPTKPTIDSEQAKQTALQSMAKWYEKSAEDFVVTEPELWIYDESLLQPSTRPVELVWRMEVTAEDNSLPIRELVLVGAQHGNISLHFNQIDTAWHTSPKTDTTSKNPLADITATTWYVATTGADTNSCTSAGSPCATINAAIGKAASGDTIKVAIGTYTSSGAEVVNISKSITLSGGWDASFTTQSGMSTIDAQNIRRGVTISASTNLERFIITNGHAETPNPNLLGGGVYILAGGSIIFTNISIQNNLARVGGGIYKANGSTSLTLNNSTIINNSAFNGSGIEYDAGGSLILNNSTISNNSADSTGGGIYIYGTSLTLNNSTISNNSADSTGGGIFIHTASMTSNNSTISSNSATDSGGGIYIQAGTGSSVLLKNSILGGNNAGNFGPDCYGTMASSGYNLIGNNLDCAFTSTVGDLVGTSVAPMNPRLGPLQDNGGVTFTHALITSSPAINAGNPATPGSGGNACLATDQRGIVRPVGGRCDIGAYEGSIQWAPPYLVSTYTASGTSSLPGTFLCNQTDPACFLGDFHAKAAHKYAIGTYNFYATQFNRDSIDNNGMTIVSTVHYCDPDFGCPYENAFWSGTQMVYGDAYGFPLADDVVAHELTHGVTQYESNLFYFYQSGAINESFSDLWGEYYDQTNGQGNDADGIRWRLGEDVSGWTNPAPLPSLGLRDMSNPTLFDHPDRMTSPLYDRTPSYDIYWDNGGVHTNSGINNKAVFLMVDGATFNEKTVTALGWDKTAAIYYETNINLLTSGADYSDLYYALQQACTNLIGQKGITAGDCTEVKDAVDAVEMNSQPVAGYNQDAAMCTTAGTVPNIIFGDDLESGTGNWAFTNGAYTRWQLDSTYYGQYAHSGEHSLYADDYPPEITDARATLTAIVIPPNAYLHFAHAYEFEYYPFGYFDGGVLEYSTNGGSTWTDAAPLIQANGYDAVIDTEWGNPLAGRSAFAGSSHGYISTRLNLASLAGQTVKFRWRMGLDQGGYAWGWWVDDVKVYTCSIITISGNAGVAGTTLQYMDGTPKIVTADGSGNYSITVRPGWSGTVTPYKTGYIFTPVNRTYNNLQNDQSAQNYTAQVCASCADVNVSIGSSAMGNYTVPSNPSLILNYPSTLNGPVKVISSTGNNIFASQRAVYAGSFNELMGYPSNQFVTEYWFPWYDQVNMGTWILVGNPSSTQIAYVDIYIGGVKRNDTPGAIPYAIPPGNRITPQYLGVIGGPVRVVSVTGSGTPTPINIFASERSIYASSFNEVMGYPANRFTTEYWFPWYDQVNMGTWILVGNPSSTQIAYVDIYIGGIKRNDTPGAIPYAIPPANRITPQFPGVVTGPVRVVSVTGSGTPTPINIFTSERSIYASSFNEVMGMPLNQFTTEYWYTWYQNNSSMGTWILVGNPSSSQTAYVDIYIAGVKRNGTPGAIPYAIPPGDRIFAQFSLNAGPVRVVSVTGSGTPTAIPIFSSERTIYVSSFNEMMGYPTNQLTTEYWFTWYDNVYMQTELLVGKP